MPEFRVLNEKTGLVKHGNPLVQSPGTAKILENWKCVRENVYTKVRGRKAYGSGLPSQDVKQLYQYQNRLHCHMGNDTIYYDSDGAGTFQQITGSYTEPETNYKIQSLENNGNSYITTGAAIKKSDTLGSAYTNAGVPKGLSFDLRVVDSTNWFVDTASSDTVAYRHCWTLEDANNNIVRGAPSERQEITNGAGATRAVELRIYIPSDVTTSHYLEVYRSSQGLSPRPEDFQLVYQVRPTSAEITAGFVQFEDILADDWRGASLYTNTTQEGISQANERPPLATSMTRYKTYTCYGNIQNLHRLYTNLISVTNLVAGTSTIKFDNGTNDITYGCYAYAADCGGGVSNATNNGSGLIRITTTGAHGRSNGEYVLIYDVTGTTEANGIWEITDVGGGGGNDFVLVGSSFSNAYVSGGTVDTYEDYGATPRFLLHTGGTDAQNIANTAQSIIRVINLHTNNTYWYGYYNSSAADPVGKMEFTTQNLGDANFYLIANDSDCGNSFSPQMPTSGTEYISTNDDFQHGVMWSKSDQTEAVPLINLKKLGDQDDELFAVIGLRDSLFAIKNKDGVFRLTGETESSFNWDEFDGTVQCLQKNSIVKGDNAIFMMSNVGYVKISDVGIEVIGRDNEKDDLKPIAVTNFNNEGYGWYYQAEKAYKITTYLDQDSTTNDILKEYNSFTQAWNQRKHGVYTNDTNISLGIVIDNLEFTAPLSGNGLLVERKDIAATDYSLPAISNTITELDTTNNTITIGTNNTLHDDGIIKQGANVRYIKTFDSTSQLTLTTVTGLAVNMVTVNVSNCADNGSGAIRVTTASAHGRTSLEGVTIASVVGTTEANGDWIITVIDSTNFDLIDSTFSNAYVSGGTVTNGITILPGIYSKIRYQQTNCGFPEYEKKFEQISLFFDDDETDIGSIKVLTFTDADRTQQTTNIDHFSEELWEGDWDGLWGNRDVSDKILTLVPEEHASGSYIYIEVVHAMAERRCDLTGYGLVYDITDTKYQKS